MIKIEVSVSFFTLLPILIFTSILFRKMALSNTLSLYRKLLKMAKALPLDKKDTSLERIRKEFRTNASESSSLRIGELLKHAESTLGYLKIISPKRQTNQSGHSRIVFGSQNNNEGKAVSNWTGKNMDPDAVKRHFNGLKRVGFRNNHDAKGIF